MAGDICYKHDYDYLGADIRHQGGVLNEYDCVKLCKKTPKCKSITYRPSGKNCWLKKTDRGAKPGRKAGLISVTLSCLHGGKFNRT